MITRDELRAIMRKDPDGWELQVPTDEDRRVFKAWVIARFGQSAWERYITHSWDA